MDHEIKEREEKYSELDSKFSRLHKRAKQRIQEVQKVNPFAIFFILWLHPDNLFRRFVLPKCG